MCIYRSIFAIDKFKQKQVEKTEEFTGLDDGLE
jgi:hypothetical protein